MRKLCILLSLYCNATLFLAAQSTLTFDDSRLLPSQGQVVKSVLDLSQAHNRAYNYDRNVQLHLLYDITAEEGPVKIVISFSGPGIQPISVTVKTGHGAFWTPPLASVGRISVEGPKPLKHGSVIQDIALVDGPGAQTQAITPPSD